MSHSGNSKVRAIKSPNGCHWPKMPIQEIYLDLFDGPHATPKPAEQGPIFLGIKNIREDGSLDLSNVRHISEDEYPQWTKRVEPQPGDIVFTYEATLNRYAVIPTGFRGCLGRRLALIRPDPTKIDTQFLFYYFFSSEWRETISRNTISGSTVDRIPLVRFPGFEISIPPIATQRKIASILSAYDDLITNNQRRIAILEEMARRLYREWFVEFRFPGHENVPMVESEMGLVPEGWKMGTFADFASIVRDGINPSDFADEVFQHFSIPAFDEGQSAIAELGRNILSNKHLVTEGSILLSKLNPRIPRVWMPFPKGDLRAVTSTEFVVLMPREPYGRMTLYALCTSQSFRDQFGGQALGTSTSHQRVKTEGLLSMAMVLPPKRIVDRFEAIVAPIFVNVQSLHSRGTVLRRTRDLLLPKLISGEIDVSELDIHVPATDALTNGTPLKPGTMAKHSAVEVSAPSTNEHGRNQPGLFNDSSDGLLVAGSSANTQPAATTPRRKRLTNQVRSSVVELDTDTVMAAFRQSVRQGETKDRMEVLQEAARRLGMSEPTAEEIDILKGHMRAAVRRKILGAERDEIWLETPTMDTYEQEELIDALGSVMRKGVWYEREEVIRAVARHLGFSRLRGSVAEPVRGAIALAIRRKVLERDGEALLRM